MTTTTDTIERARAYLDGHDPEMAAFILRDLPEVTDAGLSDYAWALAQDAYLSKNDVLYLIELLEDHLNDN